MPQIEPDASKVGFRDGLIVLADVASVPVYKPIPAATEFIRATQPPISTLLPAGVTSPLNPRTRLKPLKFQAARQKLPGLNAALTAP